MGFQHAMAMFTGCTLIPIILGFNVSLALFMAGIGTLIFHLITKGKIPMFLASSGSFIGGVLAVKGLLGPEYAFGAIAISGVVYILASLIVVAVGYKRFIALFPPIVVAPIIMTIGLTLTPIAIGMAAENWILAIVTILTIIVVGVYAKGFFKLIPIISGIFVGYLVGVFMGVVDVKPIIDAAWFAIPTFGSPKFSWEAVAIIAPIAIVTIMEHIGEVTANGSVVGKNWFKEVGLHKTLFANGVSISVAGLIGAPPNTTYGENTATLAVTKQHKPRIIRIAALIAILLGCIGKFSAFVTTIPVAVMGGISLVVFGMLIAIGIQQLIESKSDLHDMRNSLVVFIPLAIGVNSLVQDNAAVLSLSANVSFSGLSLAAVIALLLNLFLNVIFKKKRNQEQ